MSSHGCRVVSWSAAGWRSAHAEETKKVGGFRRADRGPVVAIVAEVCRVAARQVGRRCAVGDCALQVKQMREAGGQRRGEDLLRV